MVGLNSLDVALGLIFVFLVISLIVMAINEWIAQLVALRSTTLKEGIQQLLSDDSQDLAAKLYAHPLIKSLAQDGRFDRLIGRTAAPSYISSHLFSAALLDLVAGTGTEGRTRTVAEIRTAVDNLPAGPAKENLLAVLHEVDDQSVTARKAIETWFDEAMDRVSGQYKRRIQIVTIALGFLITVLANADSFALTDHLVRNPATLAAIVALAQETAKNPDLATVVAGQPGGSAATTSAGEGGNSSQEEGQATPEVDTGNLVGGASNSEADSDAGSALTPPERIQIAKLVEQTRTLHLPLGWSETPEDLTGWGGKVLGLVITAAAVSLGAPFWFDMLNKVVRIRTTGPRPGDDDAKGNS